MAVQIYRSFVSHLKLPSHCSRRGCIAVLLLSFMLSWPSSGPSPCVRHREHFLAESMLCTFLLVLVFMLWENSTPSARQALNWALIYRHCFEFHWMLQTMGNNELPFIYVILFWIGQLLATVLMPKLYNSFNCQGLRMSFRTHLEGTVVSLKDVYFSVRHLTLLHYLRSSVLAMFAKELTQK